MKAGKVKLGLIPTHVGWFPSDRTVNIRQQFIEAVESAGAVVVVPSPKDTELGCVQTAEDTLKIARMFRDEQVDGIILANLDFGNQQAAGIAVKESRVDAPVLIVAAKEEVRLTPDVPRRDSLCGLLGTAAVLRQLGVRYSVPEAPQCSPADDSFGATIRRFIAVCRVVAGVRNACYGQIGNRPETFLDVRYNAKALQQLGPTVFMIDLAETIASVKQMKEDADVKRIVAEIKDSIECSPVSEESLVAMAKLELTFKRLVDDRKLDGLSVECFPSIKTDLGICPCVAMSRLGDQGIPVACEADTLGAMAMHAMRLACAETSSLADWSNFHSEDTRSW